jgi:hypothetical protein
MNVRSSLPAKLFIVLLTLWALAVIVPDTARPFVPLGTLGISADNDGRIISVDVGIPLAPGDHIDLAKTPTRDLLAIFGGMGGLQYLTVGRTVTLQIAQAGGRDRSVPLHAREHRLGAAESLVLELDELAGIAFVLLAAFLVWAHPTRATLGFFLFAVWFNPGQYFMFYALLPPFGVLVQESLQAIFQAAGLVGFIEFALRFPNDRAEGWRGPVERGLPILFVVLAGLGLSTFLNAFGVPTEPVSRVSYGLAYALYPFVVFAFLSKLRVLPPVESRRLYAVIAGCIPGLLFFIIADSIESTSWWQGAWDALHWQPPELWLNVCYLVNALVAVSIGYAVLRQRVLPIAFLLNRGIVLGAVWTFVAMLVEGVLVATHELLQEHHWLSSILTAFVIVACAPLLERLEERANAFVDEWLFRGFHESVQRLRSVAESWSEATTCEGIERQLVDAPCETMHLASAALFRAREDGSYALAPHARGWPDDAATAIASDDPLVWNLQRFREAVRLDAVVRENGDLPRGAAFPGIVIPLVNGREVDAFVFYGGHVNGTDLSPDEIAAFSRLTRAAARARDHVLVKAARLQLDALQQRVSALSAS